MFYQRVIRPIFFLTDPEKIHRRVVRLLSLVCRVPVLRTLIEKCLYVSDERLNIKIGNLTLDNPVGLAAGFDKCIEAPLAYGMMGFGFAELGSITFNQQTGNSKPRLWRIPKDKGLIVNYGLANCGAQIARERLSKVKNYQIPLGISIASSTNIPTAEMINDYLKTFEVLSHLANYVTINVSCPNVACFSATTQVSFIEQLLAKISEYKAKNDLKKDIFVKIGPDLKDEYIDKTVDLCLANAITGIIATNLIKDRSYIAPQSSAEELEHPGGISGQLLKDRSTQIIRRIYCRAGDKLKIIGVGGIASAQDAYEKIKAGASAVQIITGWIYGGPLIVRKINRELVDLLKKDGRESVEQAVGKGAI